MSCPVCGREDRCRCAVSKVPALTKGVDLASGSDQTVVNTQVLDQFLNRLRDTILLSHSHEIKEENEFDEVVPVDGWKSFRHNGAKTITIKINHTSPR